MTVSELYNQVSQLGFETSLEDDDRFYFAANRALLQVGAIRPVIKAYVINHQPMENLLKEDTFSPILKKDELFFEANGARSYYFEVDGKGAFYVEVLDPATSEWETVHAEEFDADRRFVSFRGLIKKDGQFTDAPARLHFVGEYLYSVRNAALYGHVYSDLVADIPVYAAFSAYDISALTDDFLSLENSPICEGADFERLNQEYEVDNGRIILLPRSISGCFKVQYRHKPTALSNNGSPMEDQTVIDLDEELCALLPLLVAAYVWAEDEKELANYYLTLYQNRAYDVESRIRNTRPVIIKNVTGW